MMSCIFLIIPHSVEAAARCLGGSSAFSQCVCLFSAGSFDNPPGLCLVSHTARWTAREQMVVHLCHAWYSSNPVCYDQCTVS